jgi:poly-gamma-glutamate synthesis protein (capsule biosynthesis protein)
MTLANNHTGDYGPGALVETVEALERHGILPLGAGRDGERASRFLVFEHGSSRVRIAVLAFSNMLPAAFYADADRPGTNAARPEAIARDVAAARAEADVVIVALHFGDEWSATPSKTQRKVARMAVDAGADLVVGHHPHVLQGLERRGRALIAYSLGNFLFPSRGRASQTIALRYLPRRDGSARVEVIPCVIEGLRPRHATKKEAAETLARVARLSRALGTDVPAAGVIELPPRAASVDKAERAP